ncbi:MAG: ascorbate-dependent monooxygenase [Isosphaeraceae bacterium]
MIRGMGIVAGMLSLALAGRADAAEKPAPGPTYHKDVEPLLQKHCQDCHRPGQVAPFALLEYEQARKRATDLAQTTGEKKMPPWPASTTYGGPFHDARVLTDAEIDTLKRWAEAGAPEGSKADAPPPREFAGDWPLGPPDLVLTMPEPYNLDAAGDDDFRVFVLKTNLPADRAIRAVDFKPGNRRVVHHVIAAVDTSGRGRALDAADPKPGYHAIGGFGPGVPLRAFLPIWTPGSKPRFAPEGAGYTLPKGADILIQMHYHKSGKPELDATAIGLYLTDKPVEKRLGTGFVFPTVGPLQQLGLAAKAKAARDAGKRVDLTDMMRDILVIPPGKADYTVKGSSKAMGRPFQRDILITAVMPHMHWLGKEFTFWAVLPDEKQTRVPLIKIDHWNFNWQGTYAFEKPVRLPQGAWLEMEAHFDNSADNPNNPSKPPKLVRWGDQTNDEMCIGIFEFMAAEGDLPAPGANRAGRGQ